MTANSGTSGNATGKTGGKLTFDCPWCGAITPVPVERMGEHFPCPECKKATKLTSHNTSDRPPTEAPPDAPHLIGDRTFDCPWCGMISSVPSSHLGDRFHCAECGKETKLTATNTRAAALTAPPPDAPHVERKPMGRSVLAAAAVVVVGVVAWLAFGQGGGGSSETADGSSEAASSAMSEPTGPAPAATPATPSTGRSEPAPAAMTEPTPTGPEKPAVDVELLRAQGELAASATALADATAAHTQATAAIEGWNKAHPGAVEAADAAAALDEVRTEARRLAAPPPGAAVVTPDQARARRTAMVAFLSASPARARVGERVHAWLAGDLYGREAAASVDWKSLDWSGAGVARALEALHAAASAVAASVPADLVAKEAATRQAMETAKKRAADAELKMKVLTAPRDDRAPAPGR